MQLAQQVLPWHAIQKLMKQELNDANIIFDEEKITNLPTHTHSFNFFYLLAHLGLQMYADFNVTALPPSCGSKNNLSGP